MIKKKYGDERVVQDVPQCIEWVALDPEEYHRKTTPPNGFMTMAGIASKEAAVTNKEKLNATPNASETAVIISEDRYDKRYIAN